jgi:hypothetical protein
VFPHFSRNFAVFKQPLKVNSLKYNDKNISKSDERCQESIYKLVIKLDEATLRFFAAAMLEITMPAPEKQTRGRRLEIKDAGANR